MHSYLSYCLITIVAAITSFLAYVFDWNETHVYNPCWPPHAKFHNAQTLLLGPLLGLSSLWFLWHSHQVEFAIITASLYWVSQLGSLAFPGTALIDPECRDRPRSRTPRQPLVACCDVLQTMSAAWADSDPPVKSLTLRPDISPISPASPHTSHRNCTAMPSCIHMLGVPQRVSVAAALAQGASLEAGAAVFQILFGEERVPISA